MTEASGRTGGGPLPFFLTIFLSAFLLFQVQLVIGKVLLPWFGGTPSVWTTCLVFFQVLLLLGYAWAHLLVSRLTPRRQAALHSAVVLLALGLLAVLAARWPSPITPGASWKPEGTDEPLGRLLVLLGASVGLPFFVLSTTGPLLQGWFVLRWPDRPPYRLYALSNAGSLLGLLSYPALVEPLLPIRMQGIAWSFGFAAFAGACLACAAGLRRVAAPAPVSPVALVSSKPARVDVLLWTGLAAAASTLLLATTNQMCQDSAVIPLLWVVPLALYLLTFILCFEWERFYRRGWAVPVLILFLGVACYVLAQGVDARLSYQIGAFSAVLFAGCLVCHGELARSKPDPAHLTTFYLALAAGGAIGGLFVAVVAPRIFPAFWEFPIGLFLVCLLFVLAQVRDEDSFVRSYIAGAGTAALVLLVALGVFLFREAREDVSESVEVSRNFFGVLRVMEDAPQDPEAHVMKLRHGRIAHGFQYVDSEARHAPTSYYTEKSGVGLAILHHPRRAAADPASRSLRIGIVGLGVGTIAAYGKPGDTVRFYEINPDVLRLSSGAAPRFTYLKDCPARVEIALGDARLVLERELKEGRRQNFDVLAIDAFSSDSIPVHLLTREAFALYLEHLRKPDGVLAVHVSNRFLDLLPVVHSLAQHFGVPDAYISSEKDEQGAWRSDWVLLNPSGVVLDDAAVEEETTEWDETSGNRRLRLWTDDYSNLLTVMKW